MQSLPAVKRACRKGVKGVPTNKTPFNDLFYEELAKVPDAEGEIGEIAREVPALVKDAGQGIGGGALGALRSEGGAVAGGAARKVWDLLGSAQGGITGSLSEVAAPGIADAVKGLLWIGRRALANGLKLRFLDGQWADGSVLEIKGPGDGFQPGQLKDQKTIGKGKEPKVLSCESCNANCTNDAPFGSRKIGCG